MDENCVEIPVNVAFFTPGKLAARMQAVEPVLKSVYDVSWKKTETVPFAPSAALTKSVTRKAYGLNGSHVQRWPAEANDTPNAMTDETLESVLAARARGRGARARPSTARLLADLAHAVVRDSALEHGKSGGQRAMSGMCGVHSCRTAWTARPSPTPTVA